MGTRGGHVGLVDLMVFSNHFDSVIWLPKDTIRMDLQSVGEVKAAASLPGLQLLTCLGFLSLPGNKVSSLSNVQVTFLPVLLLNAL